MSFAVRNCLGANWAKKDCLSAVNTWRQQTETTEKVIKGTKILDTKYKNSIKY